MKNIAVTVAVLALGLAACQSKTEENAVGNEATVENAAESDTTAAVNDSAAAADAALDNATNEIANAADASGNAVENRLVNTLQRRVTIADVLTQTDNAGGSGLPCPVRFRQALQQRFQGLAGIALERDGTGIEIVELA